MNKDKYLSYGIAAVAAVGIAVWAGTPTDGAPHDRIDNP